MNVIIIIMRMLVPLIVKKKVRKYFKLVKKKKY